VRECFRPDASIISVLYYNETRTHMGLGKDEPLRRSVQRSGTIIVTPILSGLHHRYAQIWFSGMTGITAWLGTWDPKASSRDRPPASWIERSEAKKDADRRAVARERHGLFRCSAFAAARVRRPSIQNIRERYSDRVPPGPNTWTL